MSNPLPDREWIAARVPHQGTMCLLDHVVRHGPDDIECVALLPAPADHPLVLDGELTVVHGIEYAAQSMAVHGALRTGDIGYVDEDGFLFLVDRIKDVILCGGYNVYPRIIEEAAYQHPAIEEAIAIGIPDAYRGQSPKLFVALRPGQHASAEEISAVLTQHISKIEMPHEIEIRAALPKTQIGKISRKDLVAEEAARRAAAPEA